MRTTTLRFEPGFRVAFDVRQVQAAGDFLDVHLPRQADGPPPAEILERLLEGLRGR